MRRPIREGLDCAQIVERRFITMDLVKAEATAGTAARRAASVRPETKGGGGLPLSGSFHPNGPTAITRPVGKPMGVGDNGLQRSGRGPMGRCSDAHSVG